MPDVAISGLQIHKHSVFALNPNLFYYRRAMEPTAQTATPLITSPVGILMVLSGVCALFFWAEKKTGWAIWNSFPPLIYIYLIPMVLSNTGVIPNDSPVYGFMSAVILPLFLTILMLDVNVGGAIKVMGKGIFVMLIGTVGVVVGAPIGYAIVAGKLGPEAWKGFGALGGKLDRRYRQHGRSSRGYQNLRRGLRSGGIGGQYRLSGLAAGHAQFQKTGGMVQQIHRRGQKPRGPDGGRRQ